LTERFRSTQRKGRWGGGCCQGLPIRGKTKLTTSPDQIEISFWVVKPAKGETWSAEAWKVSELLPSNRKLGESSSKGRGEGERGEGEPGEIDLGRKNHFKGKNLTNKILLRIDRRMREKKKKKGGNVHGQCSGRPGGKKAGYT